jgi:death-on-curing protein
MNFLSQQYVEAIHADVARRMKVHSVLRDEELLESALARPKHLSEYSNPDVFACAASYLLAIIQSMAFTSCNKQVALICAITFLGLNGWVFEAKQEEAAAFVLAVAAGDIDETGAAMFFKDFCVAIEPM